MYYNEKFSSCKNDIKRTWRNINDILHKTENISQYPDKFDDENASFSNPHSIANAFNISFTNLGPSLAEKISNHSTHHYSMSSN